MSKYTFVVHPLHPPWGFGSVKSRRRELRCRRRLRRWLDQAVAVALMGQRVGPTDTAETRGKQNVLDACRRRRGWRSARRPRRGGSHMHIVASAVGRWLVIPCRPRFPRTQSRKTVTCNAFLVTCNRFPVTCNGRGGSFLQTLCVFGLHVMLFWLHVIRFACPRKK